MLSPFIFLIATTAFLGLWFFRSRHRDAGLWMYATYAGAFLLALSHYNSMGSMETRLPLVIRDFLLIGVAGLVQSLAVNRRISIVQALAIILVIYCLVYLLPFQADPTSIAEDQEHSYFESLENNNESQDDVASISHMNGDFSRPDPQGEYLIERRAGVTEAQLQQWALANGFRVSRAFHPKDEQHTTLDDYYVLDVPRASATVREQIEASQLIAWVEDNEMVAVDLGQPVVADRQPVLPLTNDPEVGKQWSMEVMDMQAFFALLSTLTPRKKVKIAILDTGVDAQHEDLKDNYFSTQSKYDSDPRGHGTHCAGIAAGVTNNGVGIASPAGNGGFVEITSIKVLSIGGLGTQKTIIQGMLEAVDSGVDILSMSLGGYSNSSRQRAYNQAISYARRSNVIVVAAAGNSNREATDFSPANGAGSICVAAMDELSLRAPFSNRVGGIKMAVAAPGVAVFSTYPNNHYKSFSGTSMACPFVAGLIGVLRSQKPDLTTDEAYRILSETGKRTSEVEQLGPIVQPAAALRAVL